MMIDKEKIKSKIAIIDENTSELKKMQGLSLDDLFHNLRDRAAVKYFIRTSIEAMIDISAHIIARNLLGTPSTNVEVILTLVQKKIIPDENLITYTKMVKYRNRLTHFYDEVSVNEIYDIIQNHLGDFDLFIHDILIYLEKEDHSFGIYQENML